MPNELPAAAAVLKDRIIAKCPGEPMGPSALIGALVPKTLGAIALAVADDGTPLSAGCAAKFASGAIHGGYATDRGFHWHRITVYTLGHTSTEHLLDAARQIGAHAAMFTTSSGQCTELRLYTPEGAPVTEDDGLAALRERLATGQPALPVNTQAVGTLVDRRTQNGIEHAPATTGGHS